MAFEKGESGNPAGRPKGALNKKTKELRQMISDFLLENFEEVQKAFKELPPKEKAKLYCDLLSFALPRLRPCDDLLLERLSDEELNELLEKLQDAANRQLEQAEAET
ncbi:MAG TPA: DUF5681 domain-containing protein [Bacteroidia bacterium]|jgi:hypothetical protein|nr:DUF5681 domain-containing protein [Bacteroidia bacterium]